MQRRVIITGGSGFIGSALSWRLLHDGYDVVSVDVNPPRTSRVGFVEADVALGIPEHHYLEKPTYIINLAGEPILGRWSNEKKESIYHSRVDGSSNLVKLITNPRFRPEAIISASATGFYGDSGTANVDERSNSGSGFLARVATDWEEAISDARKLGIRTTVIRNGHVLGPGGMVSELKKFARFKFIPKIGRGQNCFPWIHLGDLVNIYVESMLEPHTPNIINAVSPQITTSGEFYRTFGEIFGAREIVVPQNLSSLILKDFANEMDYGQCVKSEALSPRYKFKFPTLRSALVDLAKL